MSPTSRVRIALAFLLAHALACSRPDEVAVITMVDGGGEIRIRLRSDAAPKTVENFKKLAQSGFYDGTTFHLAVPGFIIQGGDPNSKNELPADDGFGGPGYTIPDELNDLKHARGTVSMARPPEKPDSAGSQFFIVVADRGPTGEDWSKTLDGTYTAFGEVVSGMEAVDRISQVERGHGGYPGQDDRPDVNQVIGSIRIEPTQEN
jgi:cyclophilin family peptidyl-prolyl cis-trans isomerase